MSDNKDRKSIGALWQKKTKTGDDFFTGNVEINGKKTDIIIFFSRNKKKSNYPDALIFEGQKRGNTPVQKSNPPSLPGNEPEELPM